MSVLIRKNGEILCAAMNRRHPDDAGYIDDRNHYLLSVVAKVLVTQPFEQHSESGGRWWWVTDPERPSDIDPFYLEPPGIPPGNRAVFCTRLTEGEA